MEEEVKKEKEGRGGEETEGRRRRWGKRKNVEEVGRRKEGGGCGEGEGTMKKRR